MADETLKNTLPPLPPRTDPSATLTGDTKKDIASLEKGAGNIEAFSSVMRGIGTRAYDTRQKADLELAGKQFDPTKVSGGTFASIIGNLESRRGADVSKTYTAGIEAESEQRREKMRIAEQLREEQRLKEQREREDRIRQEENDRELKKQAMMMGITDLSGSSEDLSIRIASAVNAKKKAQENASKLIWGEDKKDDDIDSQIESILESLSITETTPPDNQEQSVVPSSFSFPIDTSKPYLDPSTGQMVFPKQEETEPTYYGPEKPSYYGPELPT